ncbi:MAG: transposase [Actinomycetota bacterium]|nr:transposase [Actinomycetota bacterium]
MPSVQARYRYRLRVTATQAAKLQAVFDTNRLVWNQALGRWGGLWRHEQLPLSYAVADKELVDWRSRFEWLGGQPSVPQQQVLRDLYRSISAFFDRSNPAGRPRFKRRRDGYATARWTKRGFGVSGSGVGTAGDRLSVAVGGGRISLVVVWSRPLPTSPTSMTIYRDRAGQYWASFVVEVEVPDIAENPTWRSTGLDVGLTTFATTEDERHDITNPRHGRAAAKALARSQRNMARKTKGSNHRAKCRHQVARAHARVANQRADFHHKAARALLCSYDRIGVEDLAVRNLSRGAKGRRKTGLNRSIADAGWAQFRMVLSWQARKAGKQVVVLPARTPPRGAVVAGREPSPASSCRRGCLGAEVVDSSSGGIAMQPGT